LKSWLPPLFRLRLKSRRLGGFPLSFCEAKRKLGKEKTFSKWVSEQLQKNKYIKIKIYDTIRDKVMVKIKDIKKIDKNLFLMK